MSASSWLIRITSSGVIIGRAISGSDVLVPLFDLVRCEWRTVVSPAIAEIQRAVSMRLGVKATRVLQLLVIDSSCP